MIRSLKQGFTLVEMLVYMAMFIIVAAASVELLFSFKSLIAGYQVQTVLYRSGTNALEQIEVELRKANQFDDGSSIINDPDNGKLVLRTGGVTTEFTRTANDLQLTVDGVNKGTLLSNNVTVTNFTVYKYPTASGTFVRVRLDLSATVAGVTKSIRLYDGAVIRGDL